MPARTVVLEKLEKFNGEARVPITAGEYTQLTGRAGRRGLTMKATRLFCGRQVSTQKRSQPSPQAVLSAEIKLCPHLQHGGQPDRAVWRGAHTNHLGVLVRPIPGR